MKIIKHGNQDKFARADAYVMCPECVEFFEITPNMLRREEGDIDGK
jgi:hypothetical protein|uniref:Uncharacterized protein n=1 Tax=Siphoviridae sp. ctCNm48 TaxID=2825377 RepID=A0A8S5TWB4_9CAUD|nr:MAG TPA: hypothetical protein [Siphoviridae sp. ctCNm48]